MINERVAVSSKLGEWQTALQVSDGVGEWSLASKSKVCLWTSEKHYTYLSRRLDALDKARKDNNPRQKEAEGQLPADSTHSLYAIR
jgi:hypothetical protein